MNRPLGEVKALATNASRGAGLSWALAEEAAYATQWLESHGVAGISHLANYLQWIEINGPLNPPLDMLEVIPDEQSLKCPIALGCYIADSKTVVSDANLRVREPALLLPFLALIACKQTIVCTIDDVPVAVCADGIDQTALDLAELNLRKACLNWHLSQDVSLSCKTYSRATGDKDSIDSLMRLADKTYAPATEASRLGGAGAGITDND